jgi:hypothetical protein
LILSSFSWTQRTSKYFKLPTFLLPQSRDWIMQVVETERHLFLGKQIVTLSPDAHIKLSATMHAKFHHFTPLPSHLLLLPFSARYTTPTPHSMASEIGQNLPITDEPVAGDNKSALGGSDVLAVSSSSNMAATKNSGQEHPCYVGLLEETNDHRRRSQSLSLRRLAWQRSGIFGS